MQPSAGRELAAYYQTLLRAYGPQNWWPAQSRFEIIAGAYLTQNTAWTNVERAMANLRAAGMLSPGGIREVPLRKLQALVRPSGYFRQKAARLKGFVRFVDARYGGSLDRMFAQPTEKLRGELLALDGVGPETADSILLYAGGHEVFPVDAYTRRILERHGLAGPKSSYEEIRARFEAALRECEEPGEVGCVPRHPRSRMSAARRSERVQRFNEMHALIVRVGNQWCRKREAKCEECPLGRFLPVQESKS
jgi:endonuclease-3 related protein